MKVKIKKGKKTKDYNIINSWSDVTLDKWLTLIGYENLTGSEEALKIVKLFSDIPTKLIKQLSVQDVALVMKRLTDLQTEQNTTLNKIIEIDGIEYGFHPDLEEITLGEYADIETYIKLGIDKYLPELCAILFRPVIEKKNNIYTIEAYNGNIKIRSEIFKKMPAEQVQNMLVFFWTFVNKLFQILPSYLMQRTEEMSTQSQVKVSQKNGVGSE
tara:strand:+ start:16757 stop:17398 length:642 start_codon:yes stop_codon:yes gene_type:complete